MSAPIDGAVGSLWRTLTFPLRAAAPFLMLVRRATVGEFWVETITTRPGHGPVLTFSDHDELQRPRDGAGPLNHRSYRVRITDSLLEADQLLEAFRRDPNRFSPTAYATFVPDPAPDGLAEGDTLEVKLPGPWDGPVHVRRIEPNRIRFETLNGHMEAGWIEFRTRLTDANIIVFEIESFARSGDELFDALYHTVGIGKFFQSEMWAQVLESAVIASGGHQQGRLDLETIIYEGAAAP